jgi:ABC-type arginine transport system permease subunit
MFDSNGMMYMMRNQYHEHGSTLGHWMVGFCEIIMGKSVAQIGVISLVLPFLSYLTTLLSYAFVSVSEKKYDSNSACGFCQTRVHFSLRSPVHIYDQHNYLISGSNSSIPPPN